MQHKLTKSRSWVSEEEKIMNMILAYVVYTILYINDNQYEIFCHFEKITLFLKFKLIAIPL